MIYHFLDFVIPYVLGIDLLLIGLLYLSIKLNRKIVQIFLCIVSVLGFIGLLSIQVALLNSWSGCFYPRLD